MKTKFFKACVSNLPAAIAIISFVLFSSVKKIDDSSKTAGATQCCSGYAIGWEDLHQFMVTHLRGSQFEGGLYAKADLDSVMNHFKGDSIFIMNVLLKCGTPGMTEADSSTQTGLAITAKKQSHVEVISKLGLCKECPYASCCPKVTADLAAVYAAKIKRCCINYVPYQKINLSDQTNILPPSR